MAARVLSHGRAPSFLRGSAAGRRALTEDCGSRETTAGSGGNGRGGAAQECSMACKSC